MGDDSVVQVPPVPRRRRVLVSFGVVVGLVAVAAVVVQLVGAFGGSAPRFAFDVDSDGPGGVLTVVFFAGVAQWSDFRLGGDVDCILPQGVVGRGDKIVCSTDGEFVLLDASTGKPVYTIPL